MNSPKLHAACRPLCDKQNRWIKWQSGEVVYIYILHLYMQLVPSFLPRHTRTYLLKKHADLLDRHYRFVTHSLALLSIASCQRRRWSATRIWPQMKWLSTPSWTAVLGTGFTNVACRCWRRLRREWEKWHEKRNAPTSKPPTGSWH